MSLTMTRRTLLAALTGGTCLAAATAVAQKLATNPTANPKDKLAIADGNVKKLLLLMDADKNGKISKQEWMSFMEAEFNKLDKDGSGELDPKELMQSRITSRDAG
jgi:Ca2+-binding EF-hand superfamily protein